MEGQRLMILETSRPVLPRHIKLRFDKARDQWVILAPERVLMPDAIAVAVLQLCDGEKTVGVIADSLAETYAADSSVVTRDVTAMLQDLADKGFLADRQETAIGHAET